MKITLKNLKQPNKLKKLQTTQQAKKPQTTQQAKKTQTTQQAKKPQTTQQAKKPQTTQQAKKNQTKPLQQSKNTQRTLQNPTPRQTPKQTLPQKRSVVIPDKDKKIKKSKPIKKTTESSSKKIESVKKGKLMTKEQFDKFLQEVDYSNIKLFGKEFKPLTKRQDCLKKDCPIKFLKLNNKFNKKGNIKTKYVEELNKRYLWQYITYLRLYNKDNNIFKVEYEGEEINSMSPKYLFLLIKTKLDDETIKRVTIEKRALKSFLNKLLKNKNINNPMLKN